MAGAAVGVAEDVVEAVSGVYRLITDFTGFLSQMTQFLDGLFGPDGRDVRPAERQ